MSSAWDIAFSDHSMQGFGSREALRIVKAQGHDVPLVILSGAVGEEEAVAAMQAGAVDYVRKDNLSRLIPVVERELRAAQERRERQKAEAAQREIQARKSAMLDSALDCIVTIEPMKWLRGFSSSQRSIKSCQSVLSCLVSQL